MISQYLENITQSGTEQTINMDAVVTDLTPGQMYFAIGGIFLTIIIFLAFIYLLIKTYINKSCIGCKRLARCEKEIKEIKTNLEVGKYLDFDVFQDISNKLDDIKEDLTNG